MRSAFHGETVTRPFLGFPWVCYAGDSRVARPLLSLPFSLFQLARILMTWTNYIFSLLTGIIILAVMILLTSCAQR